MIDEIVFVYRTTFAELGQRCLDAGFDHAFPESGRFRKVPVKGRDYWYFGDRGADSLAAGDGNEMLAPTPLRSMICEHPPLLVQPPVAIGLPEGRVQDGIVGRHCSRGLIA